MARNDTEAAAARDENKASKSPAEIERERCQAKERALDKALRSEKVRYKSDCSPEKFRKFLSHRLSIWELNNGKTYHATKMFAKTKEIIDSLKVS